MRRAYLVTKQSDNREDGRQLGCVWDILQFAVNQVDTRHLVGLELCKGARRVEGLDVLWLEGAGGDTEECV